MTSLTDAFSAAMALQPNDDTAALQRATAYKAAWDTALGTIDRPGDSRDKQRCAVALLSLTARRDATPKWQPKSIKDSALQAALAVIHESWPEYGLPTHRPVSRDWLRLIASTGPGH